MALRDEVLVPFRGLRCRALFTGSAVLLRLIWGLVVWAFRAVRQISAKPEQPRAGTPGKGKKDTPKQSKEKKSADPDAEQPKDAEKGKKDPDSKTPAPKGKSGADQLERAGIVALALLVAGAALGPLAAAAADAVAPYVPVTGGLLLAAWVLAAVVVAPPEETATRNDQERLQGEQPTEDDPAASARAGEIWLVRLVLVGVRDAVAAGRKGVHLATLLESTSTGWDVATLRQHCQRLGIPTKKINIRGQGSATWGVHVDELEQVLGGPVETALAVLDSTPVRGPVEGAGEGPAPAGDEAPASTPAEAAPRPLLARLFRPAATSSPEAAP
ncbi:hypothetical protein [Streptomyces sp. RTd22]|uniref:hypothetical protein n=1 Tax=Streptomyces sp. RTd22 TaxID=1841249 RepID=UPI0007D9C40C|nr:hypothetical protein [Streptomyces sp. RTd22]